MQFLNLLTIILYVFCQKGQIVLLNIKDKENPLEMDESLNVHNVFVSNRNKYHIIDVLNNIGVSSGIVGRRYRDEKSAVVLDIKGRITKYDKYRDGEKPLICIRTYIDDKYDKLFNKVSEKIITNKESTSDISELNISPCMEYDSKVLYTLESLLDYKKDDSCDSQFLSPLKKKRDEFKEIQIKEKKTIEKAIREICNNIKCAYCSKNCSNEGLLVIICKYLKKDCKSKECKNCSKVKFICDKIYHILECINNEICPCNKNYIDYKAMYDPLDTKINMYEYLITLPNRNDRNNKRLRSIKLDNILMNAR